MNLDKNNNYRKIVTVNNQIEMYRVVIRIHSFISQIVLSITQETILCYLCVYGITEDCYRVILEDKIVSKRGILYNNISTLINKKLIEKKGSFKKVIDDLKVKSITENSAYITLKLNIKDKVELKFNVEH